MVTGIILLGGAVEADIAHERRQVTLNDAAERVIAVGSWRGRIDSAPYLSGGASNLLSAEPATESSLARDLLVATGLPAARLELEERSRNTCEQAAESKRVAQPTPADPSLLVTSAILQSL